RDQPTVRPVWREYSTRMSQCRGLVEGTWNMGEVYLTINGQFQYRQRVIDREGQVSDILAQYRRDSIAAERSRTACTYPIPASLSTCPVYDRFDFAISFGGPSATIWPPRSPPSGPRSMIQSAFLMTSRLCSITSTVLPPSTRRLSTSSNRWISAKCSPVVGSSKMYKVRPVGRLDNSRESLTRWASPPDSVVADCPSFT